MDHKEFFNDFFTLERRDDGVLLARAHTRGGSVQLSVQAYTIADHIMSQPRTIRRLTTQIIWRPWKKRSWTTSTAASASRCSAT